MTFRTVDKTVEVLTPRIIIRARRRRTLGERKKVICMKVLGDYAMLVTRQWRDGRLQNVESVYKFCRRA